MFFVSKKANEANDDRGAQGRCRRNAPAMGGFPVVFEADWCGNHRLK
jgi:hypothetical protein